MRRFVFGFLWLIALLFAQMVLIYSLVLPGGPICYEDSVGAELDSCIDSASRELADRFEQYLLFVFSAPLALTLLGAELQIFPGTRKRKRRDADTTLISGASAPLPTHDLSTPELKTQKEGHSSRSDFSPKGRLSRVSWTFQILGALTVFLIVKIAVDLKTEPVEGKPILSILQSSVLGIEKIFGVSLGSDFLVGLGIIVFLIAVASTIRRLHDVGRSGWWLVFLVGSFFPPPALRSGVTPEAIVITGFSYLLLIVVLSTKKGDVGTNRFGPPVSSQLGKGDIFVAFAFAALLVGVSAINVSVNSASYLRSRLETVYASGEATEQFALGISYHHGISVPKDQATAIQLLSKAAEHNLAQAQYELALFYGKGDGIPQDIAKAREWLTKAADNGFTRAQYLLGLTYVDDKNYAEAQRWLAIAAEHGLAQAQYHLGLMYYNGAGVQADHVKGGDLLLRSAAQKFKPAQAALAEIGSKK